MQSQPNRPRKILDSKTVTERVPKSRVQRWRDIKKGKFPAPIEIGPNKLGWFEDEIEDWLNSRPRRTYGADTADGADATPSNRAAIEPSKNTVRAARSRGPP